MSENRQHHDEDVKKSRGTDRNVERVRATCQFSDAGGSRDPVRFTESKYLFQTHDTLPQQPRW